MSVVYHQPPMETRRGPVVRLGLGLAQTFNRGWLAFAAGTLLSLLLWALLPDLRGEIGFALSASLWTSTQTWVALLLFVTVIAFVYGGFALALGWLHPNQDRILPLLALFLLLLLAANSLPITSYIRHFDTAGLPPWAVTMLALLLANAMLYFFFNRLFQMLWRELHKLYAISAQYKGATAVSYVRERVTWEILNSIKPIYLYLFSFTLFTDYLLEQRRLDPDGNSTNLPMGIVGQLFRTITTEGWTQEVWVSLLVLWLVVWPQRTLLDAAARRWERRHHVDNRA
jgi:hypothetical protein